MKHISSEEKVNNNARLDSKKQHYSAETAPFANIEETMPESKVTIPSEYDVGNAKEWVDNGSRL